MKKLTREEKAAQCSREIRATLILAIICCAWHVLWALILGKSGSMFLGIPAYASISCFGQFIIMVVGARLLLNKVFVDFDYDDENAIEEGGKAHE